MADVKNISIGTTVYNIIDDQAARSSEAIKSITRSGTTFTATRCDGTTFTFTQQDNDTTTGTTYAAGSAPANTTFGTNGSIKNVYDDLSSAKAPKSEAIKNITRSGTTFTATRCDGTTFTFTQRDNDTTTGTNYNPSDIPNNNTFSTNATARNIYVNFKQVDCMPNYASQRIDSGYLSPTSTSPYTHTAPENELVFISYWRTAAGNTLTIKVNDIVLYQIPANTAGFGSALVPIFKNQILKIETDASVATWQCYVRSFNSNAF